MLSRGKSEKREAWHGLTLPPINSRNLTFGAREKWSFRTSLSDSMLIGGFKGKPTGKPAVLGVPEKQTPAYGKFIKSSPKTRITPWQPRGHTVGRNPAPPKTPWNDNQRYGFHHGFQVVRPGFHNHPRYQPCTSQPLLAVSLPRARYGSHALWHRPEAKLLQASNWRPPDVSSVPGKWKSMRITSAICMWPELLPVSLLCFRNITPQPPVLVVGQKQVSALPSEEFRDIVEAHALTTFKVTPEAVGGHDSSWRSFFFGPKRTTREPYLEGGNCPRFATQLKLALANCCTNLLMHFSVKSIYLPVYLRAPGCLATWLSGELDMHTSMFAC